MADLSVVDLESSIKQVPGVLGCVILTDATGAASEIQAFSGVGADRDEVQHQILEVVGSHGLEDHLRRVFVFELDAESHFGDKETLERAAAVAEQDARARGPLEHGERLRPESTPARALLTPAHGAERARPPLQRVVLTSSAWRSQAQVALGSEDAEVVGEAEGAKTPHGLQVLAQATLDAIAKLVDGTPFRLQGAALVNTFGRDAVLVLVDVEGAGETLGGALIKDAPMAEAAVRATLDAVNRRLAQSP